MSERFPRRHAEVGDVIFQAEHYTVYHPTFHDKKMVDDVSVYVRRGSLTSTGNRSWQRTTANG